MMIRGRPVPDVVGGGDEGCVVGPVGGFVSGPWGGLGGDGEGGAPGGRGKGTGTADGTTRPLGRIGGWLVGGRLGLVVPGGLGQGPLRVSASGRWVEDRPGAVE